MNLVQQLADWIDILSIVILVSGLIFSVIIAVRTGLNAQERYLDRLSGPMLHSFRLTLGKWILVALEVLIVSDILHSIVHRTLDEIIFLAGTVVIRVTLAFFLDQEMRTIDRADVSRKADKSN